MNAFNRALLALIALAWCALMVGLLFLVWDEGRIVDINNDAFQLRFDIELASQSSRILASIILGALLLLGVLLLVRELLPSGRRDKRRIDEVQRRVEELQHQLDQERASKRPMDSRQVLATAGDQPADDDRNRRDDRDRREKSGLRRFLPGR